MKRNPRFVEVELSVPERDEYLSFLFDASVGNSFRVDLVFHSLCSFHARL